MIAKARLCSLSGTRSFSTKLPLTSTCTTTLYYTAPHYTTTTTTATTTSTTETGTATATTTTATTLRTIATTTTITTFRYTTLHVAVVVKVTVATIPIMHNSNHLSVHQWIGSGIHASQQHTSPIVAYPSNVRHRLARYFFYCIKIVCVLYIYIYANVYIYIYI